MKLYSPAWIILAGAIIVQGSGILGTVGSAITGIDNTITAVIDLKKMFKPFTIEPIKPVVVPPIKQVKHAGASSRRILLAKKQADRHALGSGSKQRQILAHSP